MPESCGRAREGRSGPASHSEGQLRGHARSRIATVPITRRSTLSPIRLAPKQLRSICAQIANASCATKEKSNDSRTAIACVDDDEYWAIRLHGVARSDKRSRI